MSHPLDFLIEAEEDIVDAYLHYEGESDGLGERFARELRTMLDRIMDNPQLYTIVEDDVRAAVLHHFCYVVYCGLLSS